MIDIKVIDNFLTKEEQWNEIKGSKDLLEKIIGNQINRQNNFVNIDKNICINSENVSDNILKYIDTK